MGLLDSLRSALTKAPNFNIVGVSSADTYQNATTNRNWFDQYEGYTYRAIKLKSDAVSKYKPMLKQKKGKEWVELEESPLLNDLHKFNPYQTYNEARRITQLHLDLTGLAAWFVSKEDLARGYKAAEFYILDPLRLKIGKRNLVTGLAESYLYEDGNGEDKEIPREQVILFKEINPKDWELGYSPMEAVKYDHNTYEYGSKYNMNALFNNGKPEGAFVFEGASEEEIKRIMQQFRTRYQGAENAKRTGIFSKMFSWIELSKTAQDLDYVEGMKFVRQNIMAILGVPPEMIISSDASFANADQAARNFQEYTVEPILRSHEDVYNNQLIPKYYGRDVEGLMFEFPNPVEKDRTADINNARSLYEGEIVTLNEARELAGLPAIPDGDEFRERAGAFGSFVAPRQREDNMEDDEDEIEDEIKQIKQMLSIKMYQDSKGEDKTDWRERTREKKLQLNLDQEPLFKTETKTYFLDQAQRIINGMQGKKPTLRGFFDLDEEIALAERFYKGTYESLAATFNDDANFEIKNALSRMDKAKGATYRSKALTAATLDLIKQRLDFFSRELNEASKRKLELILARQIEANTDLLAAQRAIADVFNGYIDGDLNVNTLRELGVYKEAVDVAANNAATVGSANRYNNMYELLGNNYRESVGLEPLTAAQIERGKRALKGVVVRDTDPIATQINSLLTNIDGITDEMVQLRNSGISVSRAEMIARTEVNSVKNFTQLSQYESNEFVVGNEWLTARDAFVRGQKPGDQFDHVSADGQVVPVGESFNISGEPLRYPGDWTGSAGNVINCRCSILPIVGV